MLALQNPLMAGFFFSCVSYVLLLSAQERIMETRKVIDMSVKSANVYARIEPEVKDQAESILASLGIPASNAINIFYKQIILHRGLPFAVQLSENRPVDMSALTEEQLDAELEKGYADTVQGRVKPAKEVFADIRKAYR